MTNSTSLQSKKNVSAVQVFSLIGAIGGVAGCCMALVAMSGIGFFAALAGLFFCLDCLR